MNERKGEGYYQCHVTHRHRCAPQAVATLIGNDARLIHILAEDRSLLTVLHTQQKLCYILDLSIWPRTFYTNFSPPFRFLTSTTISHLPFEDRMFRLINAESVFTHIEDTAKAWLKELLAGYRVWRERGIDFDQIIIGRDRRGSIFYRKMSCAADFQP